MVPIPPNLGRSSGVLLHLTSLPGGRLGPAAFAFVDWLASAGQSWWQVLPLSPPDRHGSPYMPQSVFAGWRGFVAEPEAPVAPDELAAFRAGQGYWLPGWERLAGRGAVADQVRFGREWAALRAYAAARGVRLFGDLPIYVAPDRADQRSYPELFLPGVIAGAPPDSLSATGQLWRNPLYDWPELRRRGYRFWTERLRRSFGALRPRPARPLPWLRLLLGGSGRQPDGEERPLASRAGSRRLPRRRARARTAAGDRRGPRRDHAPVEKLRDELGFPGMIVLQFALEPGPDNPHRPANHRELACIYTGTHDMDTALGWWRSLTPAQQAETGYDPADPAWSMIRAALASPARLAILPAQDILGLGSEARMNYPGRTKGNWSWRLQPGALTPALAARLRAETVAAGRGS